MDIDEIRRTNIRALEKLAGSPTAIADAVGMSYAQYINTRDGAKEAKTGKPRGIRKETAWRFEDAFNKPRGWLDQPHEGNDLPPQDRAFVQRVEQEVARYIVSDESKRIILTIIQTQPLRRDEEPDHPEAKAA